MRKTKTKKRGRKALVVVACLLAVAVGFAFWGTYTFGVTRYTVTSGRLPAALAGYKIAQVSDLHGEEFGKENAKLLAALQAEKPDIIVLTGDLFDPDVIPEALAFTAQAVNLAPCYYVTGNHEATLVGSYEAAEQTLLAQGVTVLHDEAISLTKNGASLWLLGVDDPTFALADEEDEQAYFGSILNRIMPESGYCILLSHRPEGMAAYTQAGVDLVLSGHAHGGQIRLPFVGGLYAPHQGVLPPYDCGLYEEGSTVMVVSRGLGNTVPFLRFNNTPEVVIITLT